MSKNFKSNQELIFFDDAFCITTVAEYNLCSNFAGSSTEYTQSGNGHVLSGIHSIMMEKSAQPGDDGGGVHALPLSFYLPSRAKVWCYCSLQLRRRIHPPLFLLYPYMYSVGSTCTVVLYICIA